MKKLVMEVLVIGDGVSPLKKGERYPVIEANVNGYAGWITVRGEGHKIHMNIQNKNVRVYGKGVR